MVLAPSIDKTAFNCPHCSAYTTQTWRELYAERCSREGEDTPPFFPDQEYRDFIKTDSNMEDAQKFDHSIWLDRLDAGELFLEEMSYSRSLRRLQNLFISECFHCKKLAVWHHKALIYPNKKLAAQPNPDLPPEIQLDFEEARGVVGISPRGAAALLRLCIQKLVKHLGESGKNIDDDIASLVKKGLDARTQKALDIVRVIGNEAVHPGTLDLKDDTETSMRLFDIVNTIAEEMISRPKHLDAMYNFIPESKRKAIERRDGK